jgi:hypothetical protein
MCGSDVVLDESARVANPPTLLTRFAEELRRAPVAGGWF